jgi:hypothetical protein
MKQFDLNNDPKIGNGFKIPENYFEQFEYRLMARLPEKEVKVVSIFKQRKFWYGAVAAIFLIAISVPMYLNYTKEAAALTYDYLAYESNLTTDDIVMHLSDEDITEIEESLDLYKIENETDVKDYLY